MARKRGRIAVQTATGSSRKPSGATAHGPPPAPPAPRTSAARGSRRCPQLPRGRWAQHHGQRAAPHGTARPGPGGRAAAGEAAAPARWCCSSRQPRSTAASPGGSGGQAAAHASRGAGKRSVLPPNPASAAARPRSPEPSLSPAPPLPSRGCRPRAPRAGSRRAPRLPCAGESPGGSGL